MAAIMYGFPIGAWCVSKIQDFSYLFSSDESGERNNPAAADFNADISLWDVSNARTMSSMFAGRIFSSTVFNQPIGNWDVSSVTNMASMFQGADSFNASISNWDVSSVTDMGFMFADAQSFDQSLADWDVSSVTDMSIMFAGATSFDQSIGNWDVSSVTDMSAMFFCRRLFRSTDWQLERVECDEHAQYVFICIVF
jgi:surface protein